MPNEIPQYEKIIRATEKLLGRTQSEDPHFIIGALATKLELILEAARNPSGLDLRAFIERQCLGTK